MEMVLAASARFCRTKNERLCGTLFFFCFRDSISLLSLKLKRNDRSTRGPGPTTSYLVFACIILFVCLLVCSHSAAFCNLLVARVETQLELQYSAPHRLAPSYAICFLLKGLITLWRTWRAKQNGLRTCLSVQIRGAKRRITKWRITRTLKKGLRFAQARERESEQRTHTQMEKWKKQHNVTNEFSCLDENFHSFCVRRLHITQLKTETDRQRGIFFSLITACFWCFLVFWL